MGKCFENFVVVTKAGRIIFDSITEEGFSPEPFSDMIRAFNALIEALGEGKLSNIEWGDQMISIIKKNDILFVACCQESSKEKKIYEDLEYLCNRFFDIYSIVLIQEFEKTGNREIFLNSERRFNEQVNQFMIC